jgi:hypothetical protein
MISGMRIGTWNLDGQWSMAHDVFMQKQACDVWLLTEVPGDISLQGYTQHLSQEIMLKGKHWAGVFSLLPLRLVPLDDPHPASAAAIVGGTTFVSSILPGEPADPIGRGLAQPPPRRHAQPSTICLNICPGTTSFGAGTGTIALKGARALEAMTAAR